MNQDTVQAEKVLYTAKVHTTGGREKGLSRSSDGRLDVRLSVPGGPGFGTNPEQLLAAGWSACFEGALGLIARKRKIEVPLDFSIDAEVDLIAGGDGYFLRARFHVRLPGVDRATAKDLVDAADQACPFSKAMRGNVDLAVDLL